MLVVWINKIHQDELEFRRLEKVLERISAQEEYLRMVKDEMLCPLRHHPATAELRILEGHLDTSGGALGRIQFLRRWHDLVVLLLNKRLRRSSGRDYRLIPERKVSLAIVFIKRLDGLNDAVEVSPVCIP